MLNEHDQKRVDGIQALVRTNLQRRRNKVRDGLTGELVPRWALAWNEQMLLADLEDELRRDTDVQTVQRYQKVSRL